MNELDANVVCKSLSAASVLRLDQIEVFPEIPSTNSYLMQQPAPAPGQLRVALADHQTAGRGRHARLWLSPPGTGLCLSIAFTFAAMPDNLPNLTLSLGVGVVDALSGLGIDGVSLKWPNDIVALDGKLGGMLAEVRTDASGNVTVVAGIGLNVDLNEKLDFGADHDWAYGAVDLKSICIMPPAREMLAAAIIDHMHATMTRFEQQGFAAFVDDWRAHDWLLGRTITVDMADRQITGVAAGVDADGALLVDTKTGQRSVTSGSIVMASRNRPIA